MLLHKPLSYFHLTINRFAYQAVQLAQHRKWSSMLIIALACKKDEIMERCSWKKKAGEPMSENRTRPAPAWHDEENVPTQKGKMFCAGVLFFKFLEKIFRKWLTIRQSAGIITPVVRHGTNIWGISSAGSAMHPETHPHSDG